METNQKTDKIINVSILLIYLFIQVFLAFHHEAWRDESQAWIIAKNSSCVDILALCSSEGHPCLWFFFLKLCQLFGLSFYHISLMSTFIMTIQSIDIQEKRFGFEPEITAKIAARKVRFLEVPISYNPRTKGEGKKIGCRDGIRAMYCIWRYRS